MRGLTTRPGDLYSLRSSDRRTKASHTNQIKKSPYGDSLIWRAVAYGIWNFYAVSAETNSGSELTKLVAPAA